MRRSFQFLHKLGHARTQLSLQVIRALVLGHDGQHLLQGDDLRLRSLGLAKSLFSFAVLRGHISRHSTLGKMIHLTHSPFNLGQLSLQDAVSHHESAEVVVSLSTATPIPTSAPTSMPIQFSRTPAQIQGLAPELGEHGDQIRLDLGYRWDDIIVLKEMNAVR